MAAVTIEIQHNSGTWRKHTSVANNQVHIKTALENAAKIAPAKKARAVDTKTGQLIDMAFG